MKISKLRQGKLANVSKWKVYVKLNLDPLILKSFFDFVIHFQLFPQR